MSSLSGAAMSANLASQQQLAAAARPIYPRAPVSLILRSWDRNSNEVDNLENRISAVARDWFGGAFPAMHDRKIQFLADFVYFGATMALGKTTLGEEQSGLALVQTKMINGGSYNNTNVPVMRTLLQPPSRSRLIVNFIAHLIVPHVIRRLWEYFFPEQDSSDGVRRVLWTHISWWWIWSASASTSVRSWVPETVASRVSGLTSVSTDLKLFGAAQQSSEQYPFLGGLTLFRVAVELFLWGREKYRNREVNRTANNSNNNNGQDATNTNTNTNINNERSSSNNNTTSGSRQSNNSSEATAVSSPRPSNKGTCPLCLAPRVNPTSTSCGHVFCWNCLSELLESGTGGAEPRCPLCREVVRPQTFVLLPNFAIPRSVTPQTEQ